MAAAFIPANKDIDPTRSAIGAIRLIMQGVSMLGASRAVMIQQCDGATNIAANFALMASLGQYSAGGYADANTAAMNAFAEIDSLYAKLTAPAGVGDATGAAIAQAAGKLGVV